MEKLPEKWKIEMCNENIAIVGEYFNKQSNTNCYTNAGNYYLYSHNVQNESILEKGDLSKSFSIGYGNRNYYEEITFDQFKQFVLKQDIKQIFKTYI